ncbi:hypothetical protein C8Q76DRAFT_704602 [Earliella scabrosa]|nr:hypothetical protein C8Q76DRAFT_704602 [Earliella scabrosa]
MGCAHLPRLRGGSVLQANSVRMRSSSCRASSCRALAQCLHVLTAVDESTGHSSLVNANFAQGLALGSTVAARSCARGRIPGSSTCRRSTRDVSRACACSVGSSESSVVTAGPGRDEKASLRDHRHGRSSRVGASPCASHLAAFSCAPTLLRRRWSDVGTSSSRCNHIPELRRILCGLRTRLCI